MADEVKEQGGQFGHIEVTLPELSRPLEKMTVKDLREIGLLIPTLAGVHAMKKEELVVALKEIYGLKDEVKVSVATVSEIKKKIRDLKAKKAEARQAADKAQAEILRRRVSRLKKKTRKVAAQAKAGS